MCIDRDARRLVVFLSDPDQSNGVSGCHLGNNGTAAKKLTDLTTEAS